MKRVVIAFAALSLCVSVVTPAKAQPGDMKGMDMKATKGADMKGMKGMDMPKECKDMMKGMDMKGMKGMDMSTDCKDMMKGMDKKGKAAEKRS